MVVRAHPSGSLLAKNSSLDCVIQAAIYNLLFQNQLKAIPDFPDTPDCKSGIRHRLEQFLAQVPDMAFHSIVLPANRLIALYILVYLPIGENLSPVHHQKIEKVIFLFR